MGAAALFLPKLLSLLLLIVKWGEVRRFGGHCRARRKHPARSRCLDFTGAAAHVVSYQVRALDVDQKVEQMERPTAGRHRHRLECTGRCAMLGRTRQRTSAPKRRFLSLPRCRCPASLQARRCHPNMDKPLPICRKKQPTGISSAGRTTAKKRQFACGMYVAQCSAT